MERKAQICVLLRVVVALATHQWLKRYDSISLYKIVAALMILPSLPIYLSSQQLSSTLLNATASYVIFYVTLILSVIAYRLSPYHPLAKYPGPTSMKLTKLRGAWIAYRGQTHVYLKAMHDKYGPTIRIGPNELSTIEKPLLPQIFGTQGMPKGPMWTARKFGQTQAQKEAQYDNIIDLQDTVLHAQLRKPWNKAFSAEPLKNYENLLLLRIRQINSHLKKVCEEGDQGIGRVNISKWICYFAFDYIGDIAFGGCFQLMRDGDKHGYFHSMEQALVLPGIAQHIPWIYPFLRSLPTFSANMQKFIKFGMEQAMRRYRTEVMQKDLFYYMSEASGSMETDLPMIISNALLAIIAGSDTSSLTLSTVMYLLMSNPKTYQQLQREVDETFEQYDIPDMDVEASPDLDDTDARYNDIFSGMPYLNAVLNEGLRLFPAVPTGFQRAPAKGSGGKHLHSGNLEIFLPEGNAMTVPAYVLHRDARYFSPTPEAFIPERWLSSSPSNISYPAEKTDEKRAYQTTRDAFIPFSLGQQNCVGRPLAMMEMRYLLATIMRNFDMVFDDTEVDMQQWVDGLEDRFTFQPKGTLPVKISWRGKNRAQMGADQL